MQDELPLRCAPAGRYARAGRLPRRRAVVELGAAARAGMMAASRAPCYERARGEGWRGRRLTVGEHASAGVALDQHDGIWISDRQVTTRHTSCILPPHVLLPTLSPTSCLCLSRRASHGARAACR